MKSTQPYSDTASYIFFHAMYLLCIAAISFGYSNVIYGIWTIVLFRLLAGIVLMTGKDEQINVYMGDIKYEIRILNRNIWLLVALFTGNMWLGCVYYLSEIIIDELMYKSRCTLFKLPYNSYYKKS